MNQIVRNEIKELYEAFFNTDSFFEKEHIVTLFDRLNSSFKGDITIKKMYESILDKMGLFHYENILYLISRKKWIEEYLKENGEFFHDNISIPNTFYKVPMDSIKALNDNEISLVYESFFKSLGEDIFLFSSKLQDEGRIIFGGANEIAFTSLNNSNAIIFIKSLNDLLDMMILVHEIGHAYYFYLNNIKLNERDDIEVEIKDEIPAKIMEMKFVYFLRKNGFIEQSYVLENMFDYVLYEYGKNKNKFDSIKYTMASDIAKTIDEDVDIKEIFKHIHDTSVDKFVLENTSTKEKRKKLK